MCILSVRGVVAPLAVIAALLLPVGVSAGEVPRKPAWIADAWGDQGDGSFVNPVLPADFSDIDAIRVGNDYYAISSTLHLSPGMVVLHSRDLVNWEIIGHAVADVTQISPEMNWDRMGRYGRGVWAGAIRRHAGKYWIYFGDPDEGLFVTTADDPAGPWAPLHQVWKTKGWNDPCPFWDDDGQGYIVTTNFANDPRNGKSYNIHLFKLSADGKSLQMDSDAIIHQSKGSEANKLDKINGLYYHYFSEVHNEGRVAMMGRAASLAGPWETRQLNHVIKGVDNEPNQGGFVQTPSGAWWFVTHQGSGAWEGRTMALLPVTWIDGWPIIGTPGGDRIGVMTWTAPKPVAGQPILRPRTDDEFDAPTLGVQWEWNHQPRSEMWSLAERAGYLRLHAFRPLRAGDFKTAGNTLSQRALRTKSNQATVKLELNGMADGQFAGLCHFSKSYAALGVRQANGVRLLALNQLGQMTDGPKIATDAIWLRSEWGADGQSQFSYSLDGEQYTPFGPRYAAAFGHYRGDRVGVFCYNDASENGYVDVDWFRSTIAESADAQDAQTRQIPPAPAARR